MSEHLIDPPLDEVSAAELRAELITHQEQLREALERLEGRVRSEIDLARLLAEHAEAIAIGAFAVGLWAGLRSGKPRP